MLHTILKFLVSLFSALSRAEAAATSAQTAERQAGIATQQADAAESSKTAAAESAKRAERFAVETEGRVTTDKTLTVSGAAADAAAVGTPSDGHPSAFTVKTTGGYPLFIPTAASGSESTYPCDDWSFNSSKPCLFVGGCWLQTTSLGLFYVYYSSVSGAISYIGCRLQELPNS
nr:MAG TPA: hypothetical protein [Caudoviricetes sp.]